jgi:hypothetical protein
LRTDSSLTGCGESIISQEHGARSIEQFRRGGGVLQNSPVPKFSRAVMLAISGIPPVALQNSFAKTGAWSKKPLVTSDLAQIWREMVALSEILGSAAGFE